MEDCLDQGELLHDPAFRRARFPRRRATERLRRARPRPRAAQRARFARLRGAHADPARIDPAAARRTRPARAGRARRAAAGSDRESTPLNSTHPIISYFPFFFLKKNKALSLL